MTRDKVFTRLTQLLANGSWDDAQELVETECDVVDVHTQYNENASQDWRKTVKTSDRYYLFGVYLMGHQRTISSYGSNDRVEFEFDLLY